MKERASRGRVGLVRRPVFKLGNEKLRQAARPGRPLTRAAAFTTPRDVTGRSTHPLGPFLLLARGILFL